MVFVNTCGRSCAEVVEGDLLVAHQVVFYCHLDEFELKSVLAAVSINGLAYHYRATFKLILKHNLSGDTTNIDINIIIYII